MSLSITIEDNTVDLDVMDETERLASLESKFNDLETTLTAMQEHQGVSQAMVASQESLLDSIPGGLRSYTKTPTKVNYSITMEEFGDTASVLIGALITAAMLLMTKIVGWLLDVFLGNKKSADSVAQAAENNHVVSEASNKVEAAATPEVRSEIVEAKDELKEQFQSDLDRNLNMFSDEIVKRTGFYTVLEKLNKHMVSELNLIDRSLLDYNRFLKDASEYIPSQGHEDLGWMKFVGYFKQLQIAPMFTRIQEAFNSAGVDVSAAEDEGDLFRIVKEEYSKRSETPVSNADIDDYLSIHLVKGKATFDFNNSGVAKDLLKLRARIKSFKSVEDYKMPSLVIEREAQLAIKNIRTRVAAIQSYYDLMDRAFKAEGRFVAMMSRYINARYNKISGIVTNSDDADAKTALKRQKAVIKSQVKKP